MNPAQLKSLEESLSKIAHAVTANASPGRDAADVSVGSLTEAVMGMTAALVQIATAIDNHADAMMSSHGIEGMDRVIDAINGVASAVNSGP